MKTKLGKAPRGYYISVFFRGIKGNLIEVPCSNQKEAEKEQAKLRAVGIYSWIEETYFKPIIEGSENY